MSIRIHKRSIATAVAALVLGASAANAGILRYDAILKGAAESPPNASRGRGEVQVLLDTDRKVMDYSVTYVGLTGPITVAGFKEAASPPDDPIVTATTDPRTQAIHAVVRLTDAQMHDLDSGKWLFDISTAASPNGEIRGQLRRVSSF